MYIVFYTFRIYGKLLQCWDRQKVNYFERNRDHRYLRTLECYVFPFVFVSFFGGPRAAGEIKFRNSPVAPQKNIDTPDFISCVTWFGASLAHDSYWVHFLRHMILDLWHFWSTFQWKPIATIVAIGVYIYVSVLILTVAAKCRLYLFIHFFFLPFFMRLPFGDPPYKASKLCARLGLGFSVDQWSWFVHGLGPFGFYCLRKSDIS